MYLGRCAGGLLIQPSSPLAARAAAVYTGRIGPGAMTPPRRSRPQAINTWAQIVDGEGANGPCVDATPATYPPTLSPPCARPSSWSHPAPLPRDGVWGAVVLRPRLRPATDDRRPIPVAAEGGHLALLAAVLGPRRSEVPLPQHALGSHGASDTRRSRRDVDFLNALPRRAGASRASSPPARGCFHSVAHRAGAPTPRGPATWRRNRRSSPP